MRQAVQAALRAAVGPYCEEARVLFGTFTTPASVARRLLINTLIVELINAGVWQKLDYLHVYAAHASQAGQLNWISPKNNQATPTSSPTFTVDRGYNGNAASSYVNTNFNPSAASKLSLNSVHIGLWSRTTSALSIGDLAARTASTTAQLLLQVRSATNTSLFRIAVGANPTVTGTATDGSGHFIGNRTASNAVEEFRNAASLATYTDASTALPNLNLYLGAINTGGTAGSFSGRQYAVSHAGASLTAQEVTDFYNALNKYLTAIGAA